MIHLSKPRPEDFEDIPEVEEIISSIREAYSDEMADRAIRFAKELIEYRDQALEEFIEKEMAGKISEAGAWIFLKGFQAGHDGFEHAMEQANPELQPVADEIDRKFENNSTEDR